MKNDAKQPHLKESGVLLSTNKLFMWWQENDFGVIVFSDGSSRKLISSVVSAPM